MRQISNHCIWIGNAGDLRNPQAILAADIKAIVDLADNEPSISLPRELIRLRFPLADGESNPDWLLRLAIRSTSSLFEARVPTIVCCSNGMSRSVCIVASAMAYQMHQPLETMLGTIAQTGPKDVSPALYAQVQAVMTSV